jgi:hypothetical protein
LFLTGPKEDILSTTDRIYAGLPKSRVNWAGMKAEILIPVCFKVGKVQHRTSIGDVVEISRYDVPLDKFCIEFQLDGKPVKISNIPQYYLKVLK